MLIFFQVQVVFIFKIYEEVLTMWRGAKYFYWLQIEKEKQNQIIFGSVTIVVIMLKP